MKRSFFDLSSGSELLPFEVEAPVSKKAKVTPIYAGDMARRSGFKRGRRSFRRRRRGTIRYTRFQSHIDAVVNTANVAPDTAQYYSFASLCPDLSGASGRLIRLRKVVARVSPLSYASGNTRQITMSLQYISTTYTNTNHLVPLTPFRPLSTVNETVLVGVIPDHLTSISEFQFSNSLFTPLRFHIERVGAGDAIGNVCIACDTYWDLTTDQSAI